MYIKRFDKKSKLEAKDVEKNDKLVKMLGKGFKRARKSRGLVQADFIGKDISAGSISGVENGKQDLRSSILYKFLMKMGLTFSEFWYLANNYELDEFRKVWLKSEKLILNGDARTLKILLSQEEWKIKENPDDKYRKLNHFMLRHQAAEIVPEYKLSGNERKQILKYLMSMNDWTKYDLTLYGNTIGCFDAKMIIALSDNVVSHTSFYKEIPENKKLIATILLNTTNELLFHNELHAAIRFKNQVSDLLSEYDICEKTVFLFASGVIKFCQGDKGAGDREMQDAIDIFSKVGSSRLVQNYQKIYDNITKPTIKKNIKFNTLPISNV